MSDSVAANREQQPPSKSFLGRLIGVYLSPGETFDDIVRKPDFLIPLIVLMAGSVAVTETLLAKIGMVRIIQRELERRGSAPLTPEQMAGAVQIQSIIAHVAGVIALPIVLLIVAGIGLLIVNALFGAKVNFKTALAVTCYSNLIGILSVLMGLAVILFGDPEHFNVNAFVPSNPGFFLNPLETSKPLMALATSVDIFAIWWMVLLGIGFSAATFGKVKARTVFLIYFGLWFLWVLGKVGLAAI